MATIYDIGDRPVVSGVFLDEDGASATPTAVTVITKTPDGTETSYDTPHATISLGATTTFTFPAVLTAAGTYYVRMKGTAGVECADEISFDVQPSSFASP